MAQVCNSSTGEVEKGKLKSVDSLGYTFALKKKKNYSSLLSKVLDVLLVDYPMLGNTEKQLFLCVLSGRASLTGSQPFGFWK